MLKAKKFKPVLFRIKLNPEQAVLICQCVSASQQNGALAISYYAAQSTSRFVCKTFTKWGKLECLSGPNQAANGIGRTGSGSSSS